MLSSFSLTSWRGIDDLRLSFGQKTYIMGANGSGKTHILDAIHMLSGSRPLYGDVTLESGSQFEGIFSGSGLSKGYRRIRDEAREYFAIQGTKVTKSKYMTTLPWRTVHISPFDMNLLYFAPSMRRDYIDLILSRTYEQFPRVQRDYDIAMRQRNAMLKKIRDGGAKREDLDFWDEKFAEYTEMYGFYRTRYRDYVIMTMSQFPTFFAKYAPIFHYESNWIDATEPRTFIMAYLKENRERDILTGHTHIGPHRDDWGFRIVPNLKGNIPAHLKDEMISVESYLSRGEMKMLLLGLKMIESGFIATMLDIDVILLIDDIFAELDDINSDIFLSSLVSYQIILTSQKALPNHQKYNDFICINLGND